MLLLLLVTAYRSYVLAHFSVNFKVNSVGENREGYTAVQDFLQVVATGKTGISPHFSTGAPQTVTEASWVYSEGKTNPPPDLIVQCPGRCLLASASYSVCCL